VRYFLDQDDDTHWYVVPEERRREWEEWLARTGEHAWDVPPWVSPIDRSVNCITFEKPGYQTVIVVPESEYVQALTTGLPAYLIARGVDPHLPFTREYDPVTHNTIIRQERPVV
jgi:hypothetical protein